MLRQGVLLGFLFLLKFIGCLAGEAMIDYGRESNYIAKTVYPVPTYVSTLEECVKIIMEFFHLQNLPAIEDSSKMERFLFDLPPNIWEAIERILEILEIGLEELLKIAKDLLNGIYPGTFWCGLGNIAPNPDAVGPCKETDTCCRDHDHCKNSISAGSVKYGLLNNGIFTRSLCECDKAFYQCLKKVDSFVSRRVGQIYFSLLKPQCFKYEHPIIRCIRYQGSEKCSGYELDYRRPKMWQWFDNPLFERRPLGIH